MLKSIKTYIKSRLDQKSRTRTSNIGNVTRENFTISLYFPIIDPTHLPKDIIVASKSGFSRTNLNWEDSFTAFKLRGKNYISIGLVWNTEQDTPGIYIIDPSEGVEVYIRNSQVVIADSILTEWFMSKCSNNYYKWRSRTLTIFKEGTRNGE